jgi:predicted Fe-Mo cluster-binding NifX family protein
MKVAVSALQEGIDAEVSPVFGRCPVYVFVDSDTMEFEAVPNPAMSAAGGAGIQAAQFAVNKGVQAVLTGNVGPNAFNVLQQAGITMYPVSGGTVRQAVEALNSGQLQPVSAARCGGRDGAWHGPRDGSRPGHGWRNMDRGGRPSRRGCQIDARRTIGVERDCPITEAAARRRWEANRRPGEEEVDSSQYREPRRL